MGGSIDGIEVVRRMLIDRPGTAVIVITAHGTVETAVEAMRAGAFDFISKPLDLNLVRQQVLKAKQHYELLSENQVLRTRDWRVPAKSPTSSGTGPRCRMCSVRFVKSQRRKRLC
ncbi:MAG: response regulator [Pirellulaceae bacterium]